MPSLEAAPTAEESERWIVGLDPFPTIERGDQWNDAEVIRADPNLGFIVLMGDQGFVDQIEMRSDVRYVERDLPLEPLYTPYDPLYSSQYGPDKIRADDAWDVIQGGHDKALCIVDTAMRTTHEDLSGPRWLGGRDVADGDNDVNGPDDHGTHVTGIATATMDNGKGIAGIAQVPFKFVKVMESATGLIWSSDLATGIRWCADNDTDVISISLGDQNSVLTVQNAVEYAYGEGLLLVAAAGNDGCNNCVLYPAAFPEVIAVGCTTASNGLCSFSNKGPEVELAAPGEDIASTCYGSDTHYCNASGTSMSAPAVAGVATLVWNSASQLDRQELRTILQNTANDQGPGGPDTGYGYGIVDAEAARVAAIPSLPVASFTVQCSGYICYFDGSASHDTGGGITSYRWDFGNNRFRTTSTPDTWYEYPFGSGYPYTKTTTLTVTDSDGYTDSTSRTLTLSWENDPGWPSVTPADPHIPDNHYDLITDLPLGDGDLEDSWFESDRQRLYIGADLDWGELTDQQQYRWSFVPDWDPIDPTFDREVPAGESVLRFEVRAGNMRVSTEPDPDPNLNGRMTVELWAETLDSITGAKTWRHIQDLGNTGTIRTYLWVSIERAYIGMPPSNAMVQTPEALAIRTTVPGLIEVDSPCDFDDLGAPSPIILGCVFVDRTGVGSDHTLH